MGHAIMHNVFSPLCLSPAHRPVTMRSFVTLPWKKAISNLKIVYEERHRGSQLTKLCKDLKNSFNAEQTQSACL